MKRSVVSIAIAVTLMLVSSGFLFAQNTMPMQGSQMQHQRFDRMRMMGAHRADMLKKLNLTDQQKQKIADLKITFQKKMVDLKADLQKSKLDLKELKIKGDFNRNDVIAAVEQINKNKNAISIAVANHMLDVYEILTPEQQKIWQENSPMMNARMHRGNRMMQHQWK